MPVTFTKEHGNGPDAHQDQASDDRTSSHSDTARIGIAVVNANVEPYAGMSDRLSELLLAGYLGGPDLEEGTLRQQVVIAFRRAMELGSTAGSLTQVRKDWGQIFGRIERAVGLTAWSVDIRIRRYRSELG